MGALDPKNYRSSLFLLLRMLHVEMGVRGISNCRRIGRTPLFLPFLCGGGGGGGVCIRFLYKVLGK